MPSFSKASMSRLAECDTRLVSIFTEVIKHFDCAIITGHRTRADQDEKFRSGLSKVQFPNSRHNMLPSMAVDAAPYPIDWNDRERFTLFAGYVQGVAQMMGIKIKWGGDWDGDTQVKDNNFDDLPHFQIVGD